MAKQPAKEPSQRQLRVAEEIRQALSQALERGDIYDPDLTRRPVTITGVSLSPDMRNAMVSFTPLGGGEAETSLKALTRQKGHLRTHVARTVHMKYVPAPSCVTRMSHRILRRTGRTTMRMRTTDGASASR